MKDKCVGNHYLGKQLYSLERRVVFHLDGKSNEEGHSLWNGSCIKHLTDSTLEM